MPGDRVDFVTRWDLDDTYLRTELDSLRQLLVWTTSPRSRERTAAGARALLRELGDARTRLHLIGSTPVKLRASLQGQLARDRIGAHELTLRPGLGSVLGLRWRRFRDKLAYVLPTLLEARVRDQRLRESEEPVLAEVVVGNDAAAVAFTYSLYADVLTGRVDRSLLTRVLAQARVPGEPAERCLQALARLWHGPGVERILIHLDRQTPPSSFDPYGARLVPFYNYLQAALVLLEDRRLEASAAVRVASTFALRHGFDPEAMARSYLDLMRRGHAHGAAAEPLREAVSDLQRAPDPPASLPSLQRMCELMAGYAERPPDRVERRSGELDYAELAKRHGRL